jgi:glycosyltransferase involved in cell wall biosynthesis
MSLAIDVRMINASGIGVYLKNILPLIIGRRIANKYHLMGRREELSRFPWVAGGNVEIIDLRSPIYSVAEQIELDLKTPEGAELFWSPHYNIPLLYGGRLVATVHDVCHLAMPRFFGGLHKRAYARLMFAGLVRKATAIICVSRFTKDELVKHTGAPADKIIPIHNGCAGKWFTLERGRPPHPRPFLLFVGNVKPHKNLVALIKAFALVKDILPYDLVIVGKKEGFITGDGEALHSAQALGGRVAFTGEVGDCLLEQYFVHATALVFPSLYEGFGLPPLEAMACGCPVIAAHAASMPEVCDKAAVYCDPRSVEDIADKILLVAGSDPLRRAMSKKGRERALAFSWEKCAAQTAAVLKYALHREPRAWHHELTIKGAE